MAGCNYASVRFRFVDQAASSTQSGSLFKAIERWAPASYEAAMIIEPDPACGFDLTCTCDRPGVLTDSLRIYQTSVWEGDVGQATIGYSSTAENTMHLPQLDAEASEDDKR